MTQRTDITCPECDTPQQTNDPFCENCGYRLGRPETAFEGHQAIPKELAKRSKRDTAAAPGDPSVGPSSEITERRFGGETVPEGHPAVKPSDLSSTRREAPIGDGTLVEGLEPAKPRSVRDDPGPRSERRPSGSASSSELVSEPEPTDSEARSDTSGSRTAPRGEPAVVSVAEAARSQSGPPFFALAIGWLVTLCIAIGITWYIATRGPEGGDEVESLAAVSQKVAIPGGKFRAGLDEKVRSLILLSCQKMSSEPDEECDQERLLGGEYPVREVKLPTFSIDTTEVRVSAYLECVEAGDCPAPAWDACKVYTHQGYQFSLRVPKSMRSGDVPMTCVDRVEAERYCAFRGGELPTNDIWEKAARGNDDRMFPWGNNWSPDLANWAEEDIFRTPVVGELDGHASLALPGQYTDGTSPYGLFDMAGNVAEWVADGDGGIARGGAWTSLPFDLRVTGRFELDPTTRRTDVGFRCAYD